jgi:hypothetical protein
VNPTSLAHLEKALRFCDGMMLGVGALMVLYVGIAVFGLVPSSARHYSAFLLFVMVMSGVAAFKVIIRERLGLETIEEGYAVEASVVPAKTLPLVWVKGALVLVGSALAVSSAAYILMHADRLERAAPFF